MAMRAPAADQDVYVPYVLVHPKQHHPDSTFKHFQVPVGSYFYAASAELVYGQRHEYMYV